MAIRKKSGSRKTPRRASGGKPEVRFSEVLSGFNDTLKGLKPAELTKVKAAFAAEKKRVVDPEMETESGGVVYRGDAFSVVDAFAGAPEPAVKALADALHGEQQYRGDNWSRECTVGAFDEFLSALK